MNNFKLLRFDGQQISERNIVEEQLKTLLEKVELKEYENAVLFEDNFHFYGLWESELLFLDNNSGKTKYPEEITKKLKHFKSLMMKEITKVLS